MLASESESFAGPAPLRGETLRTRGACSEIPGGLACGEVPWKCVMILDEEFRGDLQLFSC